jgi:asparagine synthase (glutamine-hydrolysing)
MCGIFGFFQSRPVSLTIAHEMSQRLRLRGPDDEGFLLIGKDGSVVPAGGPDTATQSWATRTGFEPIRRIDEIRDLELPMHLLGHRRLAIQDLSPLGHQPMSYRDRYWIVYNGEIYNHIELRAELEALGHQFQSHSDTEVLLAAYDQWGIDCLQRFNGMWSFVLYDTSTRSVFIARDRFGVKPFHYAIVDDAFVFASEPKAILCYPAVSAEPNLTYLCDYVSKGPAEYLHQTAFAGIVRLENASYIHCSVEDLIAGSFERKKFWSLTPNLSPERFDEAKAHRLATQYRALLEDAVRLRLRADVKIGSALSGGLDSSSIVYLANKVLSEKGRREQQETFSCVYRQPGTEDCDEGAFINLLAKFLDVHSNQIEPLEKDVPEEHAKVVLAMDTPPENTCMSGWHTFKKVAETDVTVTLDGQGADEQMAGYLGYIHVHLAHLPLSELIGEARSFLGVPGSQKHILAGVAFNLLRKIGLSGTADLLARRLSGNTLGAGLNDRLHLDSMTSLGTLIHYADRTSMAHSIESRMPFLDYRLAEFLASVPACYKMHGGWTKYLARLAFDGLLPDEIIWRRDKMGWPIPERFWFSHGLKAWYLSSIQNSKVAELLERHVELDKSPENAPQCLKALNIAAWERTFNVVTR